MSCRKNRLAQIAHRTLQGVGRLARRPSPEDDLLNPPTFTGQAQFDAARVHSQRALSHRQPDVACAVDERRAQPIVAS